MSFQDDDLLTMLRDSADRFLEGTDPAGRPVGWSAMVEMGWTGLLLPEADGGAGLGLGAAAVLMERFGAALCESPLFSHALVPSILLGSLPRGGVRDALAAGIARGDRPVALAWLERADQIEVGQPRARLADGRLRGRKLLVPMHESGKLIVPASRPEGDVLLLVVDNDANGISAEQLVMNDRSRAAHLDFDVAEADTVILARSAKACEAAVLGAAALRAAQLSGLAEATLQKTIGYLHQRSQFGQKLSQMQVLQHRVVDLFMQCRLAKASWRNAVREFELDPSSSQTGVAVSAAKARCTDTAQLVAKSAIQLHGAFGFTAEGGIGHALDKSLAWGASFGIGALHRRRLRQITSEVGA